jgi:hypothetical protein
MKWEDWIDLPTIKLCCQHASATLVAMALFTLVKFALIHVPLSQTARTVLDVADEVVLVGLAFWLAYQLACLFWKGRVRNVSSSIFVAA